MLDIYIYLCACPFVAVVSVGPYERKQKNRSPGTRSCCWPNLIKGRSAFKCLLFPWAKHLGAQTPLHEMQLILSGQPAWLLYNISVATKVNALNLISVLIISNGVVMQAEGGRICGGATAGLRGDW